MGSWKVRLTWLDCNQRSYVWIFGWTLCEDVRLACAQMPEQFFDLNVPFQLSAKNQQIIYAIVYWNTNGGDSQTSPLPIFPEGWGTSVHRLRIISLDFLTPNIAPACNTYKTGICMRRLNQRSKVKSRSDRGAK